VVTIVFHRLAGSHGVQGKCREPIHHLSSSYHLNIVAASGEDKTASNGINNQLTMWEHDGIFIFLPNTMASLTEIVTVKSCLVWENFC
jgi:hypothetical protein